MTPQQKQAVLTYVEELKIIREELDAAYTIVDKAERDLDTLENSAKGWTDTQWEFFDTIDQG